MSFDPWYFQRWAYDQKVGNPIRKLILVWLAVSAESNTGYGFAPHDELAKYAECHRRSVVTHMAALEEAGLIAQRRRGANWGRLPNAFLLLAPGVDTWPDGKTARQQSADGAHSDGAGSQSANGDTQSAPSAQLLSATAAAQELKEPRKANAFLTEGIKKTRASSEEAFAKGQLALTHKRRKVPKATGWMAARLLEAYNSETGQTRQRFKPDGSVTEDFTRVIGAVMDHPEIDQPKWERTLHTVLANPWWGDGDPTVGVIFGPNVVTDNLESPGRGRAVGRKGPVVSGTAGQTAEERDERLRADIQRMRSLDTG